MDQRTRLDLFEEIAGPMRRAAPELKQRAARAAAEWAISRTGLTHPDVVLAMNGGPPETMESLCDSLIERHYELFQARYSGSATEEEVTTAFNLGRSADAVRHLAGGEPEEAIFEAIAAAEDWSELHELLRLILGGG